jgi:hypothetical protein
LNTIDNSTFYVGNADDRTMLMPKKDLGIAIAVGYKKDSIFLVVKEFRTETDRKVSLSLTAATREELRLAIMRYDDFEKGNSITEDLELTKKYYLDEERQRELDKEFEFIYQLTLRAFPCTEEY